ncbi:hypothetical protein ACIQCR_25630 [Streptomyces sp. NPDC093249]|uniref:hypothetical protein n=1 Tax=unclassified Streptomyces TaxID=2593676 RepID=UPI0037F3741C
MSAPDERETLATSLYAHVLALRAAAPDASLPPGGLPLPRGARPPRDGTPGPRAREAREAVTALVRSALADADPVRAALALERDLSAAGIRERAVHAAVVALPPPEEAPDRARALARALTRTGTTVTAVAAGLGLLVPLGEAEDVPYLRALGLLHGLGDQAARALAPLDREAAALARLVRERSDALRPLVDALVRGDEGTARALLTGLPTTPRDLGRRQARHLAEAVGLTALLRDEPGLLGPALGLLTRMSQGPEAEIRAYDEAVALYETVADRARELPPLLGHRARLVTLAQELDSGDARLLPWPPGRRRAVLAALLAAVGEPESPSDPADRRRAEWIRRTARRLTAVTTGEGAEDLPDGHRTGAPAVPLTSRLRIEVAVGDPGEPTGAETRLLVDGRPLVPSVFALGAGEPPEELLLNGALRAGPEPTEVRLAEATCTEGCCGALHVTVRRDGPHVVWDGWRRPGAPPGLPHAPAYRFDADAYDREVGRAGRDLGWAWPARRTAWLIAEGLRERPGILARWGLRRGWISTDFHQPDVTVITFLGPPLRPDGTPDTEAGTRQFLQRLPDDGRPPRERAAEALRHLAEEDPRRHPEPGE